MTTIIKRDGREMPFDEIKIEKAILKAFQAVDGKRTEEADDIAAKIAASIYMDARQMRKIPIENIQDRVVELLKASTRPDIAVAYSDYRNERTASREFRSKMMKDFAEKLFAKNVVNQNANVDERSFGGRMGEAFDIMARHYALEYCVSPKARKNHIENRIYIHDLGHYAAGDHNCDSIPFDDLLAHGFNTRQTDVRPANSINTAFQLVAVIFQLQSLQQFGGCSATHLDWTMVPYVRKSFYKHFCDGLKHLYKGYENAINYIEEEQLNNNLSIIDAKYIKPWDEAYEYALEMTKRELKQAVEGLFHNLNTLQSRSGN